VKRETHSLLPYVVVNISMTADGKIASQNRRVCSFGSARDRLQLFELRATADAVMAGARTVDSDCVDLGPGRERFRKARLKGGLAEYNLRVIVSRLGSVDPKARVFQRRFSPIIVLTTGKASASRLRKLKTLADEVKVCGASHVNLRQALMWLRRKWGVKRLICEGGGELNDAFFQAGLVDELRLTICPIILGGRGAPTLADGMGAASLAKAARLELQSSRKVGGEMFLTFRAGPTAV
jgi:2,5-diamino-6-(ribosylamino)-4(3H)-pyrimidinone 5'-phosphate reductase